MLKVVLQGPILIRPSSVGRTVFPEVLPASSEGTKPDAEEIPPYKVIFLNDEITTMEFVVQILIQIFGKDQETAYRLMWEVHTQGASKVAILSKEQAEFKQEQVHSAALKRGFPFRCVIEPV